MTLVDEIRKSRVTLQRRRLVLKLKKLWRASKGAPTADRLIEILDRRLADRLTAEQRRKLN